MTKIKKILQYFIIGIRGGTPIIYYHLRYNRKFAKHPEKYPIEYRYKMVRKEIMMVYKAFWPKYDFKNMNALSDFSEPTLIIPNHYSNMDPLLFIAMSEKPLTFIAKKEILDFPFVGAILKSIDIYPIDRQNLMSQVRTIAEIVRHLKTPGASPVCIFAEGKRNKKPNTNCAELHAGTLKIAQKANAKVVPCALYGTFRLLTTKSYLHHYPIFMHFMDPVSAEEVQKLSTFELAEKVRKIISDEIDVERELDRKMIYSQKLTKHRKALETIVDTRVDS